MSVSSAVPDVIVRYFELDAARDLDGVMGLFTDDATVVDEGCHLAGRRRDPRVAARPRREVHVPHGGDRHG